MPVAANATSSTGLSARASSRHEPQPARCASSGAAYSVVNWAERAISPSTRRQGSFIGVISEPPAQSREPGAHELVRIAWAREAELGGELFEARAIHPAAQRPELGGIEGTRGVVEEL